MKRINIFVGHYGSGKTELAVNFAIKNKVDIIADLDTVNPYFRTNDARKILEDAAGDPGYINDIKNFIKLNSKDIWGEKLWKLFYLKTLKVRVKKAR